MPTINKPKQGGKKPRQYVKGSYIEPRYNTQHWRNLRATVLQASPLCKACESVGLITLAQMVDHISPVRLGGGQRVVREKKLSVHRLSPVVARAVALIIIWCAHCSTLNYY